MYQTVPCARGWPCDAPCCGVFTLWDVEHFRAAEKASAFERFACWTVELTDAEEKAYYVFPLAKLFRRLGKKATRQEIEEMMIQVMKEELRAKRIRKCVFLGKDDRCAIYDLRPIACRIFGTDKAPFCPYLNA